MVDAKPGTACSNIPAVIRGTIHRAAVRGRPAITGRCLPSSFGKPPTRPACIAKALSVAAVSWLNMDLTLFFPWFFAISATTT